MVCRSECDVIDEELRSAISVIKNNEGLTKITRSSERKGYALNGVIPAVRKSEEGPRDR